MAYATTARTSRPKTGRRAPERPSRGASPRLHLGRLALLVLILIGASFYVSPLRAFFTAQDRHNEASVSLAAAREEHATLSKERALLMTKPYVAQLAREDSMLVPPGTQVFVIKGLPGEDAEPASDEPVAPQQSSISVLDRIEDLWRTVFK